MTALRIAAMLTVALSGAAFAFDVGPPAGSRAPALHATDTGGKPVDIVGISGRRGVVLVFFRSARWCPFCQRQLIALREAQMKLEARGFRLAALSYDPPEVLRGFAARRQIGYQLLSDPGSVTIDAFALRDAQYAPGTFAYGVPHPSIFIISAQGVIEAKLANEGYEVRPPIEAILAAVDALPAHGNIAKPGR